jgi:hypothetical protein
MQRIKHVFLQQYGRPTNRTLLWFGILLLGFIAGGTLLKYGEPTFSSVTTFGSILPGFIYRNYWRIIYTVLMLLLSPVGNVVSFIILGIVYYLIITPVGLFRTKKQLDGWVPSEKTTDSSRMHE